MKKEFITPAIKVVNITKRSAFLCTSTESVKVSSQSYDEDTMTDL